MPKILRSLWISPELLDKAKTLSQLEGRSVSFILNRWLEAGAGKEGSAKGGDQEERIVAVEILDGQRSTAKTNKGRTLGTSSKTCPECGAMSGTHFRGCSKE